jgi:hypothetical protein
MPHLEFDVSKFANQSATDLTHSAAAKMSITEELRQERARHESEWKKQEEEKKKNELASMGV